MHLLQRIVVHRDIGLIVALAEPGLHAVREQAEHIGLAVAIGVRDHDRLLCALEGGVGLGGFIEIMRMAASPDSPASVHLISISRC